jgi:hypothetical protein
VVVVVVVVPGSTRLSVFCASPKAVIYGAQPPVSTKTVVKTSEKTVRIFIVFLSGTLGSRILRLFPCFPDAPVGFFERFGQHARLANGGHKIGIAIPARHKVDVDVP